MIHFICKRLKQHTRPIASTRAHGHLFSTSSPKPAFDCSNSTDPQSPTVSYLVNSCGLSLESAVSASKNLRIGATDQPDSVLKLLKSIGLSQSHVRNLTLKRPLILVADTNKTLKPNVEFFGSLGFFGTNLVKLLIKVPRILETDVRSTVEFFRSYGFTEEQIFMVTMKRPELYLFNAPKIFKPKLEYFKSLGILDAEISQMLSSSPHILGRSLETHITPTVQVIRRVVGTDENVLKVIKACHGVLKYDLKEHLEPNIAVLINRGVPKSLVTKYFMCQPESLLLKTDQFSEVVEKVEKLGFNPRQTIYLIAARTLARMSKSLWERKLKVCFSFGTTEDQILSAFKRQPNFMAASEKKLKKLLGFFVNELKLSPAVISKAPGLVGLSLEKRIVPRCSVLRLLMSKGVIKEDFGLVYAFTMSQKKFEKKYVSKYESVIPEVVSSHQGKIRFQGFSIELKE